jgi:hypothetical protein
MALRPATARARLRTHIKKGACIRTRLAAAAPAPGARGRSAGSPSRTCCLTSPDWEHGSTSIDRPYSGNDLTGSLEWCAVGRCGLVHLDNTRLRPLSMTCVEATGQPATTTCPLRCCASWLDFLDGRWHSAWTRTSRSRTFHKRTFASRPCERAFAVEGELPGAAGAHCHAEFPGYAGHSGRDHLPLGHHNWGPECGALAVADTLLGLEPLVLPDITTSP